MDAIRFLEEKARMCEHYKLCNSCPLYRWDMSCTAMLTKVPRETVEIVEKWSKEHPQKTLLNDFLEKFPDAKIKKNGIPRVCACHLGYCDKCESIPCEDCWTQALSEAKQR